MIYSRAIKEEEDTEDDEPIEAIGAFPARNEILANPPKLRDNHVIFLHGKTTLEHPGNVAYRNLINLNMGIYANASSLKDKLQISRSIVASIRQDSGRFLERENESGIITSLHNVKWRDVSDGKAAEITLNALREGQNGSHHNTARPSPLPPSTTPTLPAPAPVTTGAKPVPTPRDTSLLIRLNPDQSSKMKYPVGCPIWYSIRLDAATLVSQYSSQVDVSIGYVKSISMDITTRNLLYEVFPAKNAKNMCKSGIGSSKEGGKVEGLFLEEHLCYASKCPVHVQLDELMEGEVFICCFSNGWVNKAVGKSYMVTVFLKENQIRILQAVKEDCIKYRKVVSEPRNSMDAVEAEPGEQKAMHDNAIMNDLQKNNSKQSIKRQPAEFAQSAALQEDSFRSEEDAVEIKPKEKVTGAVLQANRAEQEIGQPAKSKQTSALPKHSFQPEEVISSDTNSTANSKPSTAVTAFKSNNTINDVSIKSAQNSVTSAQSHPKPVYSSSSSNNRAYSLDPMRWDSTALPSVSQSSRWHPPAQNTELQSSASSRKRPTPSASSSSNDVAKAIGSSRQLPSKCPKNSACDETRNNAFTSQSRTTGKSDYQRLLDIATLCHHPKKSISSPVRDLVQLPSWLFGGSSHNEILEALNHTLETLYRVSGYNIRIDQRATKTETQFFLDTCAPPKDDRELRNIIETVEDSLVKVIGAEESTGRMLYDMGRSFGNIEYDCAVYQRNPLNSNERIWMTVVDLPNELILVNLTDPFLESKFQDSIHQARCTLIFCKDNLNVKPLRCQPYVLVLGKQVKYVDHGVALTKRTIKQFMQRIAQETPHSLTLNGHAIDQVKDRVQSSSSHCLGHSTNVSRSIMIESKGSPKVMIPDWLLSDSFYLKEIEDGLFGSEWCKEKKFQECTGCELTRSRYYLLIKPSAKVSHGPDINRAIHMIEDSLLDFLGASESKCMLLYDLAEFYSVPSLDGIVQIRNPLNSKECVWANIIKFFHCDVKILNSLVTKVMDCEMHMLRCTLKICKENFGIAMHHCHTDTPYVMIMGRQKSNVRAAVRSVEKFIAKSIQSG